VARTTLVLLIAASTTTSVPCWLKKVASSMKCSFLSSPYPWVHCQVSCLLSLPPLPFFTQTSEQSLLFFDPSFLLMLLWIGRMLLMKN
jgi:hypothetical protein